MERTINITEDIILSVDFTEPGKQIYHLSVDFLSPINLYYSSSFLSWANEANVMLSVMLQQNKSYKVFKNRSYFM